MGEKIRKWLPNPMIKCILAGVAISTAINSIIGAIMAFAYGLCENAWALLLVIHCTLLSGASFGFVAGLDEI